MTALRHRLAAEALGTGLLLYVVVGSGIAVDRLASDAAAGLFAHAFAVGVGLAALIAMLGPVSGAHFNPAVSLGFWRSGAMPAGEAAAYTVAQVAGAVAGVVTANVTFGLGAVAMSTTVRGGVGRPVAEGLATLVLVLLILALVRGDRIGAVAPAVGAWVAAIIFATASTGFANPAVTVARVFTDTFTGIAPRSVPWFLVAQLAAAPVAAALAVVWYPTTAPRPAIDLERGDPQ